LTHASAAGNPRPQHPFLGSRRGSARHRGEQREDRRLVRRRAGRLRRVLLRQGCLAASPQLAAARRARLDPLVLAGSAQGRPVALRPQDAGRPGQQPPGRRARSVYPGVRRRRERAVPVVPGSGQLRWWCGARRPTACGAASGTRRSAPCRPTSRRRSSNGGRWRRSPCWLRLGRAGSRRL